MFIYGDELEYAARARSRNMRIGTPTDAFLVHPQFRGDTRNVLGGLIGKVLLKPQRLRHIQYRNIGYMDAQYGTFFSTCRNVVKYTVFFLFDHRFAVREATRFARYYYDGYTDTFGLAPARDARGIDPVAP
jgi:hypothetical protein